MFNTTEHFIYGLYDRLLKTYTHIFEGNGPTAQAVFRELANSVDSPYYRSTSDFDVVVIASFDINTGFCVPAPQTLSRLSVFVDEARHKRQDMIQALNYLPDGYFRMPKEMQADINERINSALQDYITELQKEIVIPSEESVSEPNVEQPVDIYEESSKSDSHSDDNCFAHKEEFREQSIPDFTKVEDLDTWFHPLCGDS